MIKILIEDLRWKDKLLVFTWHFKEDFDHFREVTKGGVCIMGRKTYEDMLAMVKARKSKAIKTYETVQNNGVPPDDAIKEILPGRECYVVTRDENYKVEGATAVRNITQAVQSLDENNNREVFILGGYRMFAEGLTWANKVYMTIVKGKSYDCDVFFPLQALKRFKITDGKETDDLYFVTYSL